MLLIYSFQLSAQRVALRLDMLYVCLMFRSLNLDSLPSHFVSKELMGCAAIFFFYITARRFFVFCPNKSAGYGLKFVLTNYQICEVALCVCLCVCVCVCGEGKQLHSC